MHRLITPALAAMMVVTAVLGLMREAPHGAGAATNLITNGTFDTDVAGWTAEDANIDLSFSGVEGDPAGSAAAQLTQYPPVTSAVSQCVTVSPSTSYDVSADALNPVFVFPVSLPTYNAIPQIVVELFSDAACVTSIDFVYVTPWDVSEEWVTRAATFSTPAGTGSALVRLFVSQSWNCGGGLDTLSPAESPVVHFDNVRLELDEPATATSTVATPTSARLRTHTPSTTMTALPTSTPQPVLPAAATATSIPSTAQPGFEGEVGAGGISPPNTGSGAGVYGPTSPRYQAVPNVC